MLKIFNVCLWSSASYWIILLPFVVLGKTLESPLHIKEIKPVNPKENQLWLFIGRTDAEAEAPVPWPPDVKNWLSGKDPDVGKDWGQEKKGLTEDEMVGWHHWLNGHECEQTLGDSEEQVNLVCCSCRVHWTWLSDWTINSCLLEVSAWTCEVVRRCKLSNVLLLLLTLSKPWLLWVFFFFFGSCVLFSSKILLLSQGLILLFWTPITSWFLPISVS